MKNRPPLPAAPPVAAGPTITAGPLPTPVASEVEPQPLGERVQKRFDMPIGPDRLPATGGSVWVKATPAP